MSEKPFLTDIKTIRERARAHMEKGVITESYGADLEQVLKVLNEALATELVCVLRYKRHYYTASGIHAPIAAEEFLEHAQQEQEHADQIAERIASDSYREIVNWLGNGDSATRRMMEGIQAQEEEHADDMLCLLERVGGD